MTECDYLIVLTPVSKKLRVISFPENIWKVVQEPPNEFFRLIHKTGSGYYRIFTTDSSLTGHRFTNSQPALPWFLEKTYDELKKMPKQTKKNKLSCITSLKKNFHGHRKRLYFINKLKGEVEFDLVATFNYYHRANPNIYFSQFKNRMENLGFNKVVKDKWEGLSPYRYSLVMENYSGPDYWSEKLTDCFLARTMPIYYGCTNLSDYFPTNSYISINPDDKNSVSKINRIIKSDLWWREAKEIEESPNLILNKYQFFPYFSEKISDWERKFKNKKRNKRKIVLHNEITFYKALKMGINARIFLLDKFFHEKLRI